MNKLRKVLITGANRGLGYKLAEYLSPSYSIMLSARTIEKAEQAKKAILQTNPKAKVDTYQLDITMFDSIRAFNNLIKQQHTQIDVLVNNGGVNDDHPCDRIAYTVMTTNLIGMINLTETILPNLTEDAKILVLSSMLGKQRLQPKIIKEQLSKPITKSEILQLARNLIETYESTGKYGNWATHVQPLYCASKALTNVYVKNHLSQIVKSNQSVYSIHPGWVKTDMGGPQAPGEVIDGIYTSAYLIDQVPFGRNPDMHGKYFNDKGTIEDI